jgi:hypothetical protein
LSKNKAFKARRQAVITVDSSAPRHVAPVPLRTIHASFGLGQRVAMPDVRLIHPMIREVTKVLTAKGISEDRIHHDPIEVK